MSIAMKNSTMVVPSKETPRTSIWLSDVDLIRKTPFSHAPLIYIYSTPNNNNNNSTPTLTKQIDDSALLKSSLGEVLVPFYPIAGRLRKNDETGRIEIDCNAKGVLFVEVETSYNISDFGDFTPSEMLKDLVMPSCNYADGLTNMPLLMVQLTRFKCCGMVFCFALHHIVGDGAAFAYLVNEWARLARGVGLAVLPDFDRTKVLFARNPPQVKFNHLEFQQVPVDSDQSSSDSRVIQETRVELFKFSQDQINSLKRQAMPMPNNKTQYSTFQVLAAHVWRCALKARGIKNDKLVRFSTIINGRPKFNQTILPQGYFGNVIFKSDCVIKSGEILSTPLWYATSKVHDVVSRVNEEYIRSHIDFLSTKSDLTALAIGHNTSACPNIFVNYWKGIPFFEADFGWGKPIYVRRASLPNEGQVYIMPSEKDEDYLYVAVNLFKNHMDRFERMVYDFGDRYAAL